jgi:hypothetical protein
MRQAHPAGERLFVDYAGQTVEVADGSTSELRTAQVFVAVLGASNYTYAEATWMESLVDRVGARLPIAIGAAVIALFAFPFFLMLDTRNMLLIWLAIFIGQAIGNRMMFAAQAAFYTNLFPVHLRYSGIAVPAHR